MKYRWLLGLAVIGMISCGKSNDTTPPIPIDPVEPVDTVPIANYDITLLDYTTAFQTNPIVYPMARQDYNELSGIAASKINNGILYMHDDAKNAPIAITNTKGEDLGTIILDKVNTINPEDISVGPGPDATKSYIYYADIGDNNFNRALVTVYRFEEPVLTGVSAQMQIHVTPDIIQLKYPNSSLNAETILIDPLTKDLYLASKETNQSTLYLASYPQSTTSITTMKPVVKTRFDLLTSGDIAPDGKAILLRNKGQIFYWTRDVSKTIAATILQTPSRAPFAANEPQGEGIGFAADNSGYYTNTEIKNHDGSVSNISFYKKNGN